MCFISGVRQTTCGWLQTKRRNQCPDFATIASRACLGAAVFWFAIAAANPAQAQAANTSFFVTSNGIGNGGNLGGLAGADNQCQTLAQAAGAGAKTWRAYLSTQAADGKPAVNARDRIGKGPWQNAKGVVVAKDVAELHGTNNVNKETALNEKGEVVNGFGDKPNRHDILTGSQPDGTAFTGADDRTCKNWTSSTQGAAMVGHSDISGPPDQSHGEILERGASVARTGWWLQPEGSDQHRWRRPAVLLRGELIGLIPPHEGRDHN